MKYFFSVYPPTSLAALRDVGPTGKTPIRSAAQHRRDVLDDMREFHPFRGRMPRTREEIAEEIGARLTVLAVRTHVPRRGRARPPVTLRMRHALRMLARDGGRLSVGRLAARVGTGVAAASQLVGRMGSRGLVEKERGRHDRRSRIVVLTEKGWAHVPRDEPMEDGQFAGMPVEGVWSGGEVVTVPGRVDVPRVAQGPSPIEEGLRRGTVRSRTVLASLRGLLAGIFGFDLGVWSEEFRAAVAVRQRVPRDRWAERWALMAALPRPRYTA